MEKLILDVKNCMIDMNYSKNSIRHYEEIWKRYLKFDSSLQLNDDKIQLFLNQIFNYDGTTKPTRYQRSAIRAMNVLIHYQKYQKIYIRFPLKNPIQIVTPFDDLRNKYITFLSDNYYASSTIHTHDRVVRKLFEFLYLSKKIEDMSQVKYEDISDFIADIASLRNKVSYELNVLRVFFKYIYSFKLSKQDFSLLIPFSNTLRTTEHLPSYWSDEEINLIFSQIDKSTPSGKRDHAVMILALKLGLRVSDIRNLRFNNINWNTNTITLVQQKTSEPLVLPLIKDVGESLIDYIMNARPEHGSDFIFITLKAPYHPLGDSTHFHNVITKYIRKAGIAISKERLHGMHTLRHTLATKLLEQETPLPVISGILGHKDIKTTCEYLRIDLKMLANCTLETGEFDEL